MSTDPSMYKIMYKIIEKSYQPPQLIILVISKSKVFLEFAKVI